MATITVALQNLDTACAFYSMAEGMYENRRDDATDDAIDGAEMKLWDDFLHALAAAPDATLAYTTDARFGPCVTDVLDNIADNEGDLGNDFVEGVHWTVTQQQ